MTLLECLECDIFTKPKKIGNEGMIKYLEKSFTSYLNTIKQISDLALSREIVLHLPIVQKFCDRIILSLKHHMNGKTDEAYFEFKNTIEVYKPFLFPETKGVVANIVGLHKPLYRARTGQVNVDLRSDMFHLPFSQSANASTQRFSYQGLPCLYLSNSIYTCWEELNRPSLDSFFVSRFQQENMDLNILDLSLTSDQLRISRKLSTHYYEGKYDYDFVAFWYLMVWPLSFICSIPVANDSLPFKQEYIFPQFLLRWVSLE